jgi:hypothetical protein
MKKFFLFGVLIFLLACDDGDLQIETLDFDSTTIQTCEGVSVDTGNLLFKLNATEALILELPFGAIRNEASEGSTEYAVSATGTVKVTYRTFSDNVSTTYFCADIPVTTPTVLDEIIAEGGSVFITSTLSADELSYNHVIELSAISLVTSKDVRITDLSINNFGTVTTEIPIEEEG